MAYELEIEIKRNENPFRVTGIDAEARVEEITTNYLAAWGIPIPNWNREHPTLIDSLTETGYFRRDEADYQIIAKRAS